MQASSVKDLPDMERLKSAKLTGLRWDIDPVVIEYFRYLLNDVVSRAGRKNSSGQQAQNIRSSSSSSIGSGSSRRRDPVKSTSAMLMSDRRLSVVSAGGASASSANHSEARRCSMFRQFSTVQQQQQPPVFNSNPSTPNKALARWKKVPLCFFYMSLAVLTRMWANAQRDGRPAEYRWRPLFNAAKFG